MERNVAYLDSNFWYGASLGKTETNASAAISATCSFWTVLSFSLIIRLYDLV